MSDAGQIEKFAYSGSLGRSPLLLAVLAVPLCVLWSVGYAYLDVYLPIGGVLTVFMILGYAFAVAMTVSMVGKLGKCRNPAALKLMGLGIGVLSLYVSWVVFLHALFARNEPDAPGIIDFITDPAMLWQGICVVNESGWYTIKGSTPSGIFLWILWVAEAVVVVGGAWWMSGVSLENEMFCEACGKWCEVGETTYRQPAPGLLTAPPAEITPLQLLTLEPLPAKALPSFRAELLQCPGCKRAGVRFARLYEVANDKGEKSQKSDTIPGILLPPSAA